MDFLESVLQAAKAAEAKNKKEYDDRQAILKENVQRFETGAEALECARRLATLKPGDPVKFFDDEAIEYADGIFLCHEPRACCSVLYYCEEEKRLMGLNIDLFMIKLP